MTQRMFGTWNWYSFIWNVQKSTCIYVWENTYLHTCINIPFYLFIIFVGLGTKCKILNFCFLMFLTMLFLHLSLLPWTLQKWWTEVSLYIIPHSAQIFRSIHLKLHQFPSTKVTQNLLRLHVQTPFKLEQQLGMKENSLSACLDPVTIFYSVITCFVVQ
jgi:hypothetical protein